MGTEVSAADLSPNFRVTQLESQLAGMVSAIDDANARAAALEAELVAARSLSDDWRDIAIQLAATCRDLRESLSAATWNGHARQERAHAQ